MKYSLEFEIETDPIHEDVLIDALEDFADTTEYNLRHYIKDNVMTNDDLDEIFVKYNISTVVE